MLSFGISDVKIAIVLGNQCWMGLTRNESHIVSTDGLEHRLRSRITPYKVMAHIRGICARVATMVIVRRFFDLSSSYFAMPPTQDLCWFKDRARQRLNMIVVWVFQAFLGQRQNDHALCEPQIHFHAAKAITHR